MRSDWEHRIVCLLGTVVLVVGSMLIATHPLVPRFFDALPVIDWSSPTVLSGDQLWVAGATTLLIVVVILTPLFEPRPRRILDTIAAAEQRVVMAIIVLATIGYFDYTYRLPRTTLIELSILLLVFIPAWFVVMQRRPASTPRRAIIIGNDREQIEQTAQATDVSIIGYVAPLGQFWDQEAVRQISFVADGGRAVGPNTNDPKYLGNISQLGAIFVEYGIDTAVLAFDHPDRAEFFGTLSTCREYGVEAKAHRTHADSVLTIGASSADTGDIVDIELEPLNWYDHVLKRAFDVAFSVLGLVVLAPVIVIIAAAIRLDDSGPVLVCV